MSRANVTSSSGNQMKIGNITYLTGTFVFSSSQTDQGAMYFGMPDSLHRWFGIMSSGNYNLSLSSANNENVWLTYKDDRVNATSAAIKGNTAYFTIIGVPI